MTKPKHTPGPWTVIVHNRGDRAIYLIEPSEKTFQEAEANATLIAAAPDMLEALELALEIIEHYKPTIDSWSDQCDNDHGFIKQAIAKARGEL